MQNSDNFAEPPVRMLTMAKRRVLRWLPIAALLALAGTTFQSSGVQAQDTGGRQAFAAYSLEVDSTNLDRVCLGHRTPISFKVRAHVLVVGPPNAGAVTVLNPQITAGSENFSIATVDVGQASQSPFPDVPYENALAVTGVSLGATTVWVDVVGPSTNRFGSASSFHLRHVMRVRVVPCAYRVDVTTFWLTQMYSADVLISATMVNIPLTSLTGITFSNDVSSARDSRMQWTFTTNRLKGCLVSTDTFRERGVSITGLIVDDELSLTVTIPELPTSTNLYIQCRRPTPVGRVTCDDWPDATCHPANEGGRDSFSPVVPDDVHVPIDGGTITVNHTLNHSQGSAVGRTTVTVTLEPQ